jgi:hypothetical protein
LYREDEADRLDEAAPAHVAKEHVDGLTLARRIREAAANLPALALVDEQPLHPTFDCADSGSLDFSALVSLREAHETDRAKVCLRTRSSDSFGATTGSEPSVRQKLARGLYAVMKKHQDFDRDRLSTGLSRAIRWIERDVPTEALPELTGNSKNAKLSADGVSKAVSQVVVICP